MAGVQVGVGYIDIRPDLSGFGRQLRSEVSRDIAKTGDDASRSLKQSFTGAAKGAAAAFGAAFAAVKIKDFLGGAIQAASDLNEQVSKSNAVFDEAGKGIETWAAGAADNIGLSKRAALEAVSTFGNMFIQLGTGADEAATLSKSIVELGVDFRSFTDADITEVLQAQSAAFRGEYDSLQKFLPLISAATVQQRAMELTGKKNADQLTAQEKALATYRLMIEGAGDAAGDFARTHDSLANQQQRLNAQWENAKSDLGDSLIPLMLELAKVANDVLLPALKTLFLSSGADANGWAASLRDAIGDTIGFILGAFGELARGVANVVGAIPGSWGEGAVKNLREVADAIDGARVKLHASTGELVLWGAAADDAEGAAARLALVTRGYLPDLKEHTAGTKDSAKALRDSAKATRDAGAAERDLRRAKADLSKLEKQGAVDAEKVAEARERLAEATRSAGHADRELAKARREFNEAEAAFNILGTDTAADELADAKDNLADASDSAASAHERELEAQQELKEAQAGDPDFQDKLADAKDKVADAQDRIADTADKIATNAKAAKTAQEALNKELSFTKDQVRDIVDFLDEEIKPKTIGEWLTGGGLLGPSLGTPLSNQQPAFTLPAFGVPGSQIAAPAPAPAPILGPPVPTSVTTNNQVDVHVAAPASNPDHIAKAIVWALN